jgi:dihydrofolate reductase
MEAILALDSNNGLSKEGILPWKSLKDLQFLYKITKNNVVIMSKYTYLSLPDNIRPLRNRLNIVLTHHPNLFLEDSTIIKKSDILFTNNFNIHQVVLHNRENFCAFYPSLSRKFKIFFIGGKDIYDQYIPLCEAVWVTRIKKYYACDLTFEFDIKKQFKELSKEEDDDMEVTHYVAKL